VVLSNRLIANHSLPDKAIDVIDDAGAYVKMKQEKAVLPEEVEEVKEARKRLRFIAARHENAVDNHEFEKARFYFEEERTQREALAQLHLKHNIPERQIVAKEDIEEALARWTGMPIEAVREVSGHSKIESHKPEMPPKKKARKKKS
jgi:ATP-dependent Clp protease ATP-binding subunit ClpC